MAYADENMKKKHGFYYKNEGEDSGSISAVVPSRGHLSGFMGD